MARLITALLFVTAQVAFGGIYELSFQRVAASGEQQTCQAFAAKVAEELERQSGATVVDAGCEMDEFTLRGWDAVITYQASEPVKRVSTYSASVYSAAFYSSREECTKRLESLKQGFTKATGLQPLAAYCPLDISLTPRWESRIDGLGEAALEPITAGMAIWGELIDASSVFADFQTAAQGYGLTLYEGGVNRKLGHHLVLKLYAPEPFSLRDYNEMTFDTVEACSRAAAKVKGFIKAADKPVTVFCDHENGRRVTLHATEFYPTLKSSTVFKAKMLTTAYPSLAACEQATDKYTSKDVFGAACAGAGQSFRVHLFSRP